MNLGPDRADGPAHFHARITRLFDAPFSFPPVLAQRRAGIGEMMFRVGGNHHQDPIGTVAVFLHFDGPVHGGFPDGHAGKGLANY